MPHASILNDWILVALAMFFVYIAEEVLSKRLGIVSVPLYVFFGVFLGSINLYNEKFHNHLEFVSMLATVIVSLSIGAELTIHTLKQLGKKILLIVTGEVLISALFVFIATKLFGVNTSTALILASVASATAPAAIVFVIKKFQAKGKLTISILATIGIDDVFSLLLFAFGSVISFTLLQNTEQGINISEIILGPLEHIGIATILGIGLAYLCYISLKRVQTNSTVAITILGMLIGIAGLGYLYHSISPILTAMIFGSALANFSNNLIHRVIKAIEPFYELTLPLFFIFTGSLLNIGVAKTTLGLGIIYTLARMFGKYAGAFTGAWISKSDSKIRNLIGLSLVPQLGVSVGILIAVKNQFSVLGEPGQQLIDTVSSVLIWTTMITELIGPALSKLALRQAGEIRSIEK